MMEVRDLGLPAVQPLQHLLIPSRCLGCFHYGCSPRGRGWRSAVQPWQLLPPFTNLYIRFDLQVSSFQLLFCLKAKTPTPLQRTNGFRESSQSTSDTTPVLVSLARYPCKPILKYRITAAQVRVGIVDVVSSYLTSELH